MALLGNACRSDARVPPELASARSEQIIVARLTKFACWIFRTAILFLLCLDSLCARAELAEEYPLKAAFLKNFATYVEWPSNVFANASSDIVIGVLGKDPFGNSLDVLVEKEKVQNRKLVVIRYTHVEEIKTCHVLFISQSEEARLYKILGDLKGRHILTVGDNDLFVKSGGIIGFVVVDKRIRFMINGENAESEALKISSQLRALAIPIKKAK